jgi:haloalkane dehalogenase
MSRIFDNKFSRRAVGVGLAGLALTNLDIKMPLAFGHTSAVKRTPEERFRNLPGYDFAPHYIEVTNNKTGSLRMHYIDEGSRDGHIILCLHGQASWSYLYRKMIPILVGQGFRVIAPDYVGFGRSDKLASDTDYSYQGHIDWLKSFLLAMNMKNVTAFLFDWGGHFGLRIAADNPDFFNRIILSNTLFPMGPQERSDEFVNWAEKIVKQPVFPIGEMVSRGVFKKLSLDIIEAYDAPFPDESFKAGPRTFPMIMPIAADRAGVSENRAAWQKLSNWEKPLLTLFSKRSAETEVPPSKFQNHIAGARGQPHALLPDAGFFIMEDKSEELADRIVDFVRL